MTSTIERAEIPAHMRMETGVELPEGFSMLSIPDASGDTRIMWNPRDKADTKIAEQTFDTARKNGMMVYLVDPTSGESSGEVITSFKDVKREGKLIAVKPIQGG